MNILYDDNMPYAHDCFSLLGDARPYNAKTLAPHSLADVDALVCRSTLTVNSDLLRHATRLKMVATATAGFNHLDTHYLQTAGISWYSAAGCNALAVAEFVISALLSLNKDADDPVTALQTLTVAIVGAGNVGTALSKKLDALKVSYYLCDPPLAELGDERDLVSLESALAADVICLHVPLIQEGKHSTEGLISHKALQQLTEKQVVINACRGGVLDEQAYLAMAKHRTMPRLILDAWCDEPAVNDTIFASAQLATPHIAGHSLEGKARGSFMVYEWLTQLMEKNIQIHLKDVLPVLPTITLTESQMLDPQLIPSLIFTLYDIHRDDRHFRQLMAHSDNVQDTFMLFRANYPVRREFSAQRLNIPQSMQHSEIARMLENLEFSLGISTTN